MMNTKRIGSKVLEQIMLYMMILFSFCALGLFMSLFILEDVNLSNLIIFELLLIVIISLLAQTIIMIRIYRNV